MTDDTITDAIKKLLTEEVLGECYHEGRMPINCGYLCMGGENHERKRKRT